MTAPLAHRFKPGQSGNPAGRPKKLLKRVDELCHEKGIHPFNKLMELLDKGDLKDSEKADIWLQVLGYVQSKAKIPVEEEPNPLENLSTEELIKLVKSLPEPKSA